MTIQNTESERRIRATEERIRTFEESNESTAKVMKQKCDEIKRLDLQRMLRQKEHVELKVKANMINGLLNSYL